LEREKEKEKDRDRDRKRKRKKERERERERKVSVQKYSGLRDHRFSLSIGPIGLKYYRIMSLYTSFFITS